jgi:MFS family permease
MTVVKYRHEGLVLLFQYPEYAKRWIGSVVSGLGNQLGWMALVWLVMELTGGASSIGIVTLLYQLPQAIFAPLAGVALDRYPRSRVMAIANFALAVVFTCIPIVAICFGRNGIWLVYLLVALAGVMMPFDTTGAGPLTADLIPSDRLPQANFLSQTIWQIVYLVGPALGGVLIAWIGTHPLLYFDAATFLFLGILMLTVSPVNKQKLKVDQNIFQNLKDGIVYLFKNHSLLALAILSLLFNLFYGPYLVLLPDLAKSSLGGSTALGLLWFTFSVGALGGGLVFSAKSWKYRLSVSLAMIIVLWGVVTIGLAFETNHLWLACVTMCMGGLVFAPWGALVTTVRQRIVPRELQGRTFGASTMITAAGSPVGAWLTGILLPTFKPHSIFLISGIVTVAIGFFGMRWPAIRDVDRESGSKLVG